MATAGAYLWALLASINRMFSGFSTLKYLMIPHEVITLTNFLSSLHHSSCVRWNFLISTFVELPLLNQWIERTDYGTCDQCIDVNVNLQAEFPNLVDMKEVNAKVVCTSSSISWRPPVDSAQRPVFVLGYTTSFQQFCSAKVGVSKQQ